MEFPNWINRIGSFFKSNGGFYINNTYQIGKKGVVWIDTCKPKELYDTIPQLRDVIDKKGSMFSNMEIKLEKISTNEEIADEQLHKLLNNPNPLQSMNQWLNEFKKQEQIYGNQFIYKNKPSNLSKYPLTLSNISSHYIRPILTGKLFDQLSIEDIISGYELSEIYGKRFFYGEEILFSRLTDLDNPIIGQSPLIALRYPLTNTKLAYTYRNIIMSELGAPKLISSNAQDTVGKRSLTEEEKLEVAEAWSRDYGIEEGKSKVKIIGSNVKVENNAFPTRDLMLFEEVVENQITICDHFGMNVNLFGSKASTYENVRNGIIQTYQDTIQPEADLFMQSLGKFLNIPAGTRLRASYDHLSILQADKQKNGQSLNTMVLALQQAVQSGFISGDQAEVIISKELGIEPDANVSKTLSYLNRLSPLVANNVIGSMTVNEARLLIGLGAIDGGDEKLKQPTQPTTTVPAA